MQWLLVKAGVQAFEMGHGWQLCYLESPLFLAGVSQGELRSC